MESLSAFKTAQGQEHMKIPLLPASAIESLFCVDVSKIPPIELVVLAEDPSLLL